MPWHRGYMLAFEAIVRDAVITLGGPTNWALPWNYFKPGQNALPAAFGSADRPDGNGDNPLFVKQRYGPYGDGDIYVVVSEVDMNGLSDPDFSGVASGGSPGFGGVSTGFAHGGALHGRIATSPH